MANKNLTKAKKEKNDEFYTQYTDIQKEVEAYLEYDPDTFRGKLVYCNCDDPFESNFFCYFALNFKKLGLRQLITTSYKPSPIANTQLELFGDYEIPEKQKGRPKITANKFVINEVGDIDDNGEFNLEDIARQLRENRQNEWTPLEGDGDFRSEECISLLEQANIVVTNPPFSLFREYVRQLIDYDKKFLIIGSMNAITYKEIFPLIKDNKLWLGNKTSSQKMFLEAPKEYTEKVMATRKQGMWWRIIDGKPLVGIHTALWFTNLEHGRRHQPLPLMTMEENLKYSNHKEIRGKEAYDEYDNYDAIEVPYTDAVPSDYEGAMGVPISFLDKYCPEQFEILGATESEGKGFSNGLWDEGSNVSQPLVDGQRKFKRIFIKHSIKNENNIKN
ncbi:MAG: DNA methyltransferase [Clostridia bacterium]|nr:DNA methyltransferase [Clostridia bacterium]